MNERSDATRTIRTIRLGDEAVTKILDDLDHAATTAQPGGAQRHIYRQKGVVVRMQQPGSGDLVPFQVATRNLSEVGLSFLHGGFVHVGTVCSVQLITSYGTWHDVAALVAECRYVDNSIHEVQVTFSAAIDPAEYCTGATRTQVLMAEDEPLTARLAMHHLKQLNAVVEHVLNGKEAVERALNGRYDLVLLDIEMPVMDGMEAVRTLRGKGYTGPIVAATAKTGPGDKQKCLDAGFDRYLAKPFTRAAIQDLLLSLREEALFSSMCGDPSMEEMINGFVAELPGRVRELEQALIDHDAAAIERVARSMKGQGGCYGFDVITEVGASLETSLRDGKPLKEAQSMVDELIKLCRTARPASSPT